VADAFEHRTKREEGTNYKVNPAIKFPSVAPANLSEQTVCGACNRGVDIAGKLNETGICEWCERQGRISIWIDPKSVRKWQ